MTKLFFSPSTKINSRISELVISGYHIVINGITYEQLSRRPAGKMLRRSLVNENTQERILIYG